MNDQSDYEFKIKRGDLKRSMEFKVLTHVSQFTNDLVDKDFLIKNLTHSTVNSKSKKLPKLNTQQTMSLNKINFGGEKKMYDTRGKKNISLK